ncbi:MAG: clostripain-related cysteine peptidase [Oligoflexia bacterium]|nr:clostripain-related cysteine peptidase [Oligoflexia bacterium]
MFKPFLIILACLFFSLNSQASSRSNSPDCKKVWTKADLRPQENEDYSTFYKRQQRNNCLKDWTILVYMAADNDLAAYALWDLYEMEAGFKRSNYAGSSEKLDLLVQYDGPENDDLRRLHMFSFGEYKHRKLSDFQRSNIENVQSPIIEKLPENRRDKEADRLINFLSFADTNYPSKHTMLIVWGHGQGWKAYPITEKAKANILNNIELPSFPESTTDKNFGGIAFRKSSDTWLDIPALKSVLKTHQESSGKALDIYASDACLMQMVEVAYELSPYSRFIVGSTQVQNFLGLPYRRLLYEINKGTFNGEKRNVKHSNDAKDEPYLLSKMIPNLMKQSMNPRSGLQGRSDKEGIKHITSSSISSIPLEKDLIVELKKISLTLHSYLREEPMRIMDMMYIMQNVPSVEGNAQDLGVFLGYLEMLLIEEKQKNGHFSPRARQLHQQIIETKTSLDFTVLSYAYGTAYGIDEITNTISFVPRAISIWIPLSEDEYKLRKREFMASEFYKDTKWNLWLDYLYNNK